MGRAGVERRAEACHPSPPEKEKAALGGLLSFDLEGEFSFLPPIIRIPNPAIKHAKIL
jgi:hypothetical protein